MKQNIRLAASAVALLALGACQVSSTNQSSEASETQSVAKLAEVRMNPDTAYLSAEEREVVNLLIQAADLMQPIYLRQVSADNARLRAEIEKSGDKAQLARFDQMMGPWDEMDEDKPFIGTKPRPAGGGFYPEDLTQADYEAYVKANPAEAEKLNNLYTVVKRDGDRLVAVPYSVEYREWLEPAAKLLEQAAAKTSNPSLKKFLTLRAQAFRTDDYFESELAWMDLKDTPIEVVIGPYETYTDRLFGRKAAFEAYVGAAQPRGIGRARCLQEPASRHGGAPSGRGALQELQARVRISDQRRRPDRGRRRQQARHPGDRLQPAQRRARARGQGREEGHPAQCARRQVRPYPGTDGPADPGAGGRSQRRPAPYVPRDPVP